MGIVIYLLTISAVCLLCLHYLFTFSGIAEQAEEGGGGAGLEGDERAV